MAIELLEMSTEEFVQFINKYPEFGDISVLDFADAVDTFPDLQQDDVVIYTDYCTDDCRGSTKENQFFDWLGSALSTIDQFMREKGYVEIDQLDGSGGGLWYGATVYRKV